MPILMAILLFFAIVVDFLFFMVIATGAGTPAIIISQLLSGGIGWIKIRKLDFNLFFFVEAERKKREPVIPEIWDELLLLSGACLLVYPGIFTDVIGFTLLFRQVRETVLEFFPPS